MINEYNRAKDLEKIQNHLKALEDLGMVVDRYTVRLDESAYQDYFGYNCTRKQNLAGHVEYTLDGVTYTAYVGPYVSKYKCITE